MALKLNIRPEIEAEMERLLLHAHVRSKTEYINQAIEEYNRKLKREFVISGLKRYFSDYQGEGREMLHEFSKLESVAD